MLLLKTRSQTACDKCGLSKQCYTPMLPAELSDQPEKIEIAFIGEAPGRDEDAKGRPFVGKSGQLLRKLVAKSSLGDVPFAILNAVNCRPPDNKTPNVRQVTACSPMLKARLKRLPNLKVIVLLGKTAVKALVAQDESLDFLRARPLSWNKIPVIATYHPAAVLRQRETLRLLWEDLERAALIVRNGHLWKSPHITVVEGWRELEEEGCIKLTEKNWAFDIESTGLSLKSDKVISASISQGPNVGMFFLKEKPGWDLMKRLLNDSEKDVTIIGQNLIFDASMMRKLEGVDITDHPWFDTRIAYSILYPEQRRTSLKIIGPVLTRINYPTTWSQVNDIYLKTGRYQGLMKYNTLDTVITYRLFQILRQELARTGQRKVFDFVCELAKLASVMQSNGIHINREELSKQHTQMVSDIAILNKRLSDELGCDIHAKGSAKRIEDYLFGPDGLGLKATRFTEKSGKPSMAEADLSKLEDKTGFISTLLKARKLEKFETSYARKLLGSLDESGMVYPSYNVVRSDSGGTVTGRITLTNPPIQTFPKEYLSFLDSRFGKDGTLIKADLSQIELRVVADLSDDTPMIETYRAGLDLHRKTASEVFGKRPEDITDSERRVAKTVNFGIVYGTTPQGLKDSLEENANVRITLSEAKTYVVNFYKAHPAIAAWQRELLAFGGKHGFVKSPTGRIRNFPDIGDDTPEGRSDQRAAVNFPIQSGAADIASWGMYRLWQRVKHLPVYLVANIYDAILVDCLNEHIDFVKAMIKESFEDQDILSHMGWRIKVPIKIDIEDKQAN